MVIEGILYLSWLVVKGNDVQRFRGREGAADMGMIPRK